MHVQRSCTGVGKYAIYGIKRQEFMWMTLIDIQMIDAQGFMLTILIPFSARLNS